MVGVDGIKMKKACAISIASIFLFQFTILLLIPKDVFGADTDTHNATIMIDDLLEVTGELRSDAERSFFPITIHVKYNKKGFVIESEFMGVPSFKEAVSQQKAFTFWRKPYLFLYMACGGSNSWRCEGYQLFSLKESQLAYLGEIDIKSGKESKPEPAFDGKHFFQVYDKLESNSLTSHSDSPDFLLALVDDNNKLKADLKQTWSVNSVEYERNWSTISESLKSIPEDECLKGEQTPQIFLMQFYPNIA